uniref:Uncharacterized protein n=1 Tax=Avena sativa TaxID=4498 RepID=A0ACD5WK78_AVESA
MAASCRKGLMSRTLERCWSRLTSSGDGKPSTAPGCFSVYVGPERERFVVRADRASHPLFRRLLDDAEREYGYAAQGPLTLPCDVDAFIEVLWHMDNDRRRHDHDDGRIAAAAVSPICGMQRGVSGSSKGRAAGYRMLSTAKSSPASFFLSLKASPTSTPTPTRMA